MTGLLPTRMVQLADGTQVRVSSTGTGPDVVMTHGYPDNLQIWSRVAPMLSDRFTVHAFDWPGLGHSGPASGGATPYHLADQITRVLDGLSIDRAHLVGLDMGGQPALLHAKRHPDRTAKVVVSNSLVMSDGPTSLDIRIMRNLEWNARILLHLPPVVFRRALLTFLPLRTRLTAEVRHDFYSAFSQRPVRERLVKMCAGYQASLPRLRKDYEAIETPVLALWGEWDSHFPVGQVDALATRIPHLHRAVIDAPHWMAWSHPDQVADQIGRFLAH